jgi:ABC-type Na+ efflux pump permease subunit
VNASPVIVRELRAESRRSTNYWLRILAAATLILAFATVMSGSPLRGSQLGAVLFNGLNRTLYYGIWLLVPLMTADCVSREKREGTLGLLFLTPLSVLDVIAGKATIHVLRAMTLLLAALPVLGLPFVLGGIEWRWAILAAVTLGSATLLSIAAGIYASSRGGSTIQVMVLAEACAWGLALASMLWAHPLALILPGGWLRRHWFVILLLPNVICSTLVFALLLRASIRRLKRTWHEESAAPEQPRWVQAWTQIFSTSPFWQTLFRWNKSRTLDRNPVAWLQEYSWTARLTKWGWFVLLLLAVFFVLADASSLRTGFPQYFLTGALALGVSFSAVGSFRREQQTGLLELLLVTPLTVRQLLGGRLWGICAHYLPALGILWFGWTGARLLSPRLQSDPLMLVMFPNPLAFVSLMVVGLYLSLSPINFFLAWFFTWVVAFILPLLLIIFLGSFAEAALAFMLTSFLQVAFAALLWNLLQRKVQERAFLLRRADKALLV